MKRGRRNFLKGLGATFAGLFAARRAPTGVTGISVHAATYEHPVRPRPAVAINTCGSAHIDSITVFNAGSGYNRP